jgi:hypothetical protein
MTKFALKRLTKSDLTIFDWHFVHHPAGNQKGINLNRDVFEFSMYPSLSEFTETRGDGRVPIVLLLYGPGLAEAYRLDRKIIKNVSYKNWRLDGELISSPVTQPERFNGLRPGDMAVMAFKGHDKPEELHIDFLSAQHVDDRGLLEALYRFVPLRERISMQAVNSDTLVALVNEVNPPENHPIRRLIPALDALEQPHTASQADTSSFRFSGRAMSPSELQVSRQRAEIIGRSGEELIESYFRKCLESNIICYFNWVAVQNAISPYDFEMTTTGSNKIIFLDVKSTEGQFSSRFFVSFAEIIAMGQADNRYDLYRVYELNEIGGKLRIAEDMRNFANSIIASLNNLPYGVRIDGFSIEPDILPFGDEKVLFFNQ